MTSNTLHDTIYDVIYLASCAVREIAPDLERVRQMDLDEVYREASRQMLASCCAFALESAGMCPDLFAQAKAMAVRKIVLMDIQRKEVLDKLEAAGIWYLPLKGAVLKDYYPTIGMREMSDNDIMFDSSRTQSMRTIMNELGFTADHLDTGAHDCFYKAPIYNFEMHHVLFDGNLAERFNSYYANITEQLVPDADKDYGYHFSPEDFYLYIVAHMYKHYCYSGTGVRGCLDTYVYLSKTELDMAYVTQEAEKLGIANYEQINRDLSLRLVNEAELSEEELGLLGYMQKSGVYGNFDSLVEHRVSEVGGGVRGKISYICGRAFPSMEKVKQGYPFFYRHRFLLPLLPIVRLCRSLTISRQKTLNEIKALRKSK